MSLDDYQWTTDVCLYLAYDTRVCLNSLLRQAFYEL